MSDGGTVGVTDGAATAGSRWAAIAGSDGTLTLNATGAVVFGSGSGYRRIRGDGAGTVVNTGNWTLAGGLIVNPIAIGGGRRRPA